MESNANTLSDTQNELLDFFGLGELRVKSLKMDVRDNVLPKLTLQVYPNYGPINEVVERLREKYIVILYHAVPG